MAEPKRVLSVDDHPVLRAGIEVLLDAEPGVRVVGEAATGEEGVEKARDRDPDIVLMDLSMPGTGGLEAMRRIASSTGRSRTRGDGPHGGGLHLPRDR